MSEFSAALGMLQLKHVSASLRRRKEIDSVYRQQLAAVNGIRCLDCSGEQVSNYAYFPILVERGYRTSRDDLYHRLRGDNIYARRYFYPLISEFPMYRGMPSARRDNLPVATDVAARVLCLPIYATLETDEQQRVIDIVRAA
jgi:dTDP-4-amino-4,6-dideoxygalactose transaminase